MLVERFFFYVKLIVLLLVVVTEGKKKKNKKKDYLADDPATENTSTITNLCDIQSPTVIYCYCNVLEEDAADEGNCWIFNDTSDKMFDSVWEAFSTQKKIKHLTLHLRPDGTLKKIPTIAILHLPDLEWFEVQYASIHTTHSFSFGNSSSIEKISLARNAIRVLEPYSFANMPKLTSITLGENQLTEINRTVFSNLPQLTHLFIDRNNITSIEDFAFQELKNLKELELFSNQIQAIVPETFKGLSRLERLDLHKNWIEILGDMTFQDLKMLKFLDLRGNSIKYIAPKSFYGLNKLHKLILQDNKLLSLGSDVFKYTTNLLFVDLRQNVLETLTQETIEPLMPNLKKEDMHINLKGNVFRCDTRLLWMFALHNTTKSRNVRLSLEEIYCYLETGTLPPRLEDVEATPLYEMTTMGIGPRTELLQLLPSELPDPLIRTPATFLQGEDCDEEEEGLKEKEKEGEKEMEEEQEAKPRMRGGRGRGRGRGRKNRPTEEPSSSSDDQQNDMAAPHPSKQKGHQLSQQEMAGTSTQLKVQHEMQPAAPVQDSRPYTDQESSGRRKIPSGAILVATLLSLVGVWSGLHH